MWTWTHKPKVNDTTVGLLKHLEHISFDKINWTWSWTLWIITSSESLRKLIYPSSTAIFYCCLSSSYMSTIRSVSLPTRSQQQCHSVASGQLISFRTTTAVHRKTDRRRDRRLGENGCQGVCQWTATSAPVTHSTARHVSVFLCFPRQTKERRTRPPSVTSELTRERWSYGRLCVLNDGVERPSRWRVDWSIGNSEINDNMVRVFGASSSMPQPDEACNITAAALQCNWIVGVAVRTQQSVLF